MGGVFKLPPCCLSLEHVVKISVLRIAFRLWQRGEFCRESVNFGMRGQKIFKKSETKLGKRSKSPIAGSFMVINALAVNMLVKRPRKQTYRRKMAEYYIVMCELVPNGGVST